MRHCRLLQRPDAALPPSLVTRNRSAGLGVAVAEALTCTAGSRARAAPAARRPARDPRRRRGTETAARSASRVGVDAERTDAVQLRFWGFPKGGDPLGLRDNRQVIASRLRWMVYLDVDDGSGLVTDWRH